MGASEQIKMVETTNSQPNIYLKRRNPLPLLITGLLIGLVAGAPLGWFSHQFYYRYRSAQVLLCRQQNFGQTEPQLKAVCGSLY